MPDTERVEQPWPQVLSQGHPGVALDDAGQRVRARLAVGEDRARLAVGRDEEESANWLHPVARDSLAQHFPGMAAGHRGDMPDPYRPATRVGNVSLELAEMRDDSIVQPEQALRLRERRSRGGEDLAERVQQLRPLSAIRRPPALRHHMSMPHHHQAVHLDIRMIIHGIEEAQDRSRVDLLIGRRATWQ